VDSITSTASLGRPDQQLGGSSRATKEQISIRLDRDVLEHFRRYPRYQTRINAILRAAMKHEKKAG